MPSRAAAAAMSSVLREKPKRLSAMTRVKCLAILCRSSTAPTLRPMAAAPRSGWRLAGHCRGDARQFALGGGEQILAPAGTFGRQCLVAADDQAFAGKIR